jgi:hypothetical protein
MRLARRALLAALSLFILCAAGQAQTLRSEADPRNIAPTVGTGGPVGGPTGLFTIYDGQTLRRGEFTFSFAYSNYDRDPGNVDITEVPVSFQIGLNDWLELFFNTDVYRGIKVNNPQNLSSFYLPNAALSSSGAIVLAPATNLTSGLGTTGAIFRQAGTQPYVAFPFFGGSAGAFNLNEIGTTTTIGATRTGEDSNWGAADNFPGLGSIFGSILPGPVMTTGTVTSPTTTTQALVGPVIYSTAPAYLPDAPFISRYYGTSSFSTFTVGGKIRLTEPDNPLGVGIIPFYRWYADKADDAGGFNMLQRGASPGGNFGDIGLVGFMDGRLARSVNLSVNAGYILNSNPRSDAITTGEFTLLDRPDEFIAGIGFDFPINRYFQPIAELKSVQYVGGRTPNALENSPLDVLGGVRVFPTRWMGFSAAYRRHLNQQDRDRLGLGSLTGFAESDDPNGFLAQFFIGRRNERAPEVLPNQPPTVSLSAGAATVNICPTDPNDPRNTSPQVQLSSTASDPDGDTLLYTYSTTGGRITGEGPNVTWDLAGVQPGTYTATVEVDDGCGCVAFSSTTVTVTGECSPPPAPPCPTISVDCPTAITEEGRSVTFTASATGGASNIIPTYTWSVSAGTISSGQGTPSITVDTTGLGGQSITATVEVGGLDPSCSRSASCTAQVGRRAEARKFDEYGNIAFNDEKARLDNFAIQLQNEPGSQGYIIGYGGRRGRAGEGLARADRAKDYVVNTRGIEAGRIVTVDGGHREDLTVELWIVPTGATPPTATPTVQPSEVQTTRPARRARRRR